MPYFTVHRGLGIPPVVEEFKPDDELVIWFTRRDFRRFLKADLGHDPTDEELDDILRCSDTTDLINAIVDNYADGDKLDFLKRKE